MRGFGPLPLSACLHHDTYIAVKMPLALHLLFSTLAKELQMVVFNSCFSLWFIKNLMNLKDQ